MWYTISKVGIEEETKMTEARYVSLETLINNTELIAKMFDEKTEECDVEKIQTLLYMVDKKDPTITLFKRKI